MTDERFDPSVDLPALPRFKKTDYSPVPDRLRRPDGRIIRRTYPNRRGWGAGWPHAQTNKLQRVVANRINGIRVREEIAELVEYLIKATNALGLDLRKTAEKDGGIGSFANRAIKKSNPPRPSNHSWGLALDLNTKSNPMRKVFMSTMLPKVIELWESAGFYWGGRYPVPPWFYDAMHVEYMGRPEDVANDLKNAQDAYLRLSGGTTLYPTLRLGMGDNETMVRVAQDRLNFHGFSLDEDGIFDQAMDTVVRAFQKANELRVDGIIGPITWGELNDDPAPGEDDEPEEDPAD